MGPVGVKEGWVVVGVWVVGVVGEEVATGCGVIGDTVVGTVGDFDLKIVGFVVVGERVEG